MWMAFPLLQKWLGSTSNEPHCRITLQRCLFLLNTGDSLAVLHWVTGFTQLNFGQLIPTSRVHNNYKTYKKCVLYWRDEVLNPGPNIDFLWDAETLIWEQNAAGMVFVPFALLLPWKRVRGRGARDFYIAGGIPGQCIGKVLFAGSLVIIASSCQPVYAIPTWWKRIVLFQ